MSAAPRRSLGFLPLAFLFAALMVPGVVLVAADPDWRWPVLNYSWSAIPWTG